MRNTRLAVSGAILAVLLIVVSTAHAEGPTTAPATQPSAKEKLTADMLDYGQKLADAIAGVTDVESARAAVPKMEAIIPQMTEAMQTLAAMPEGEGEAFMKEVMKDKRVQQLGETAATDMNRIQANAEIWAVLKPVFRRMPGLASSQQVEKQK